MGNYIFSSSPLFGLEGIKVRSWRGNSISCVVWYLYFDMKNYIIGHDERLRSFIFIVT
jgi:hypothetical protein